MKDKLKIFSILLLSSLLLMGMDYFGWLYWPKKRFSFLARPLQSRIHAVSSSLNDWQDLFGVREKQRIVFLENEQQALKEEISLLQKENKELKEENKRMEYLLQVPTPPQWNFQPAKVLRFDGSQILIDKGREQQIKEGMVVIKGSKDLNKAVLIGKISKANPITSVVNLPNNPNREINVELLNGGEGLLRGKANAEIELFNVLQEIELEQNELVLTSGTEGEYPQGLLIGRIKNVIKEESEVYQQALVEPINDYAELDSVFVVLVDQFK